MVILKFFGVLLLICIFVAVVTFITVLSKFRSMFQAFRGQSPTSGFNTKERSSTVSGQPKQRTSKIDKNEGEYVDFEEID